MSFEFSQFVNPDLPAPSSAWAGFPEFNFVGGHNDPGSLNLEGISKACASVLAREGHTLSTYSLESGPQGYLPLREFLVSKLQRYAGIECTVDEILLTSGSLQAIDLINQVLVKPGDTVIVEASNYSGVLARLMRLGVNMIPVRVDADGMDCEELAEQLASLATDGIKPRYLYSIPTVHNPTGSIMSLEKRKQVLSLCEQYAIPVFEDECYADLVWDQQRPPALLALDNTERVVHVGSFSKTIAPALRVGYVVASWSLISQLLALKTDAGSGALEQMLLAEYCTAHFDEHVTTLNRNLQTKLDALTNAIDKEFGSAASYDYPPGGIFLWVTLPDGVNTARLAEAAAKQGVAINPGPEWSLQSDAQQKLRVCFANPDIATIELGIAKLASICFEEFGVPLHGSNRKR